jgi:hypothetical protein
MIAVLTYIMLDTTCPEHNVDPPIDMIIDATDNDAYCGTLELAMYGNKSKCKPERNSATDRSCVLRAMLEKDR